LTGSNIGSKIPTVIRQVVLGILSLALSGCLPRTRNACEGMIYKEAGLTRAQFRACAAEMVKQLDLAQSALQVMADRSRPRAARTAARQQCLAATGDLSDLMRTAGGSTKLLARWDDSRLNQFNFAVRQAKDEYMSVCYYGARGFDQARDAGVEVNSGSDSSHEMARQILAEIQ
jgi:hypothetical protein